MDKGLLKEGGAPERTRNDARRSQRSHRSAPDPGLGELRRDPLPSALAQPGVDLPGDSRVGVAGEDSDLGKRQPGRRGRARRASGAGRAGRPSRRAGRLSPALSPAVCRARSAFRRDWGLPRAVEKTSADRCTGRRSFSAWRERCARSSRTGAADRHRRPASSPSSRPRGASPSSSNWRATVSSPASRSTSSQRSPSASEARRPA